MAIAAPPAEGWRSRIDFVERQLTGSKQGGSAAFAAKLAAFLDLMLLWNTRLDLTGARSADELVDLVLADALVIAELSQGGGPEAKAGHGWVDVGSGAGAPAIPLALLRPELSMVLCEPQAKRVAFLRTAVGTLGRTDLEVRRSRSDALAAQGWDVAFSRATLPAEQWLKEGARLARRSVWLLLGKGQAPSLPSWQITADRSYALPLTGAERRAVCFSKAVEA